eukprot:5186-Heterococcus_DN1.PRE.2
MPLVENRVYTCVCDAAVVSTIGRGTEGARSSYSSGGRGSHGSNMNINGIENLSPGSLSRLTPAMSAVTGAGKAATKTVLKRAKGLGEGAKRGVTSAALFMIVERLFLNTIMQGRLLLLLLLLLTLATTAIKTASDAFAVYSLGVAEAVKILTVGSMSATGFVTFKTLGARASAVQALIAHQPGVFEVRGAPEPRDIVWPNVTRHVRQIRYRYAKLNGHATHVSKEAKLQLALCTVLSRGYWDSGLRSTCMPAVLAHTHARSYVT